MTSDDAASCRAGLDRLATLLADLRFVERAMAHLDTVDTCVTPPAAAGEPAGVLTVVTFRLGSTHPIERAVVVYDDATFEERTIALLGHLAHEAARWARAESDHLLTAARPVLALVPGDTAAVRAALLADREALVLDVDTDLADLRLRLAPWHGLAKDSYLLDFHGPLVDAHRTHTTALVLCAKAVTAIEIAARGAQRSLRHTVDAAVELVDALLLGWQAAQAPPREETREFLTMAARGADLLAFVAMPRPDLARAARLTAQGLRWLEHTVPEPPDVDLPAGVATKHGRLVGAEAEQTATDLAAGVADVVAALDEVLGEVAVASRDHEEIVARATLAPREPDALRPGRFDHAGGPA